MQIPFSVSAKTARLIGRENVSKAEGAIIELVKNSYDADARDCILFFDNKYIGIPNSLNQEEYIRFSEETNDSNIVTNYYDLDILGEYYQLKTGLPDAIKESLKEYFKKKCFLYIIDNGHGMTLEIIKNHWMMIGTDYKENVIISKSGSRVLVGAKGIGRFALDRLGRKSTIYTLPQKETTGYSWNVDWDDFEKPGLPLSSIKIQVNTLSQIKLWSVIKNIFINNASFLEKIKNMDIQFSQGTILCIELLRDDWNDDSLKKLFESLQILSPPVEHPQFNIYLFSSRKKQDYGLVETKPCDDYDYKLTAEYDDNKAKKLKITIQRSELDINAVKKNFLDVFTLPKMGKYPFDLETLEKGAYTDTDKDLFQLAPGYSSDSLKPLFNSIGSFKFVLYFMKLQVPTKDKQIYPYKSIYSAQRKEWLEKFGGIKIFRDNFRVRPYGEAGNDWLNLGERAAKSPQSAGQREGEGYRIRPNQVAGTIFISRTRNPYFPDIAGREGIQENPVFILFKEILINIIKLIEKDRSIIMASFKKLFDKKNEHEQKKIKASQISKDVLKKTDAQQATNEGNLFDDRSEEDKKREAENKKNLKTLAEAHQILENELAEKEDEVRLVRGLASIGLMVSAFAHEFTGLNNQLSGRIKNLVEILQRIIKADSLKKIPHEDNPYNILKDISEQDTKIKHWLNLAIKSIAADKRKRQSIVLDTYATELFQTWKDNFAYRHIQYSDQLLHNHDISIKAFKIDLDTIFNNLIANSIWQFENVKPAPEKQEIIIEAKRIDNQLEILYKDTGNGLAKEFKDPYQILEPFVTTKRNQNGEVIGTGLGMHLVKTTIDEYNGDLEILTPAKGFALKIYLPLEIKEEDAGG